MSQRRKLWWLERRKGKIVVVRIRLGQHNEGFLFIEEAFVVLRRKGKIVVFESAWDNIMMAFSL